MIVRDMQGNIIDNPDLSRGSLERTIDSYERPYDEYEYIYFPYNEQEREMFDFENQSQSDQDAAICELYEMMG